MMLTPEQQKQNRLELALCDILHEMDCPVSYTQNDDRYDIWILYQDGDFKRIYVAMSFNECQTKIPDYYNDGHLVLMTPHVQLESCEAFFLDMGKAGLAACAYIEKAQAASELPKTSRSKAKPRPAVKRKTVAK